MAGPKIALIIRAGTKTEIVHLCADYRKSSAFWRGKFGRGRPELILPPSLHTAWRTGSGGISPSGERGDAYLEGSFVKVSGVLRCGAYNHEFVTMSKLGGSLANWAVKRQPGAPMAQATVTLPASFSEEIERTSLFRQAKSIGLELLGESAQNSVGRPSKQRAAKLRAIDDAATYLAWPTKRVSYTWHIASMAEMRAKLPRNFIEAYMRAFLRTILGVAVAPVARPDAGAGAAAASARRGGRRRWRSGRRRLRRRQPRAIRQR